MSSGFIEPLEASALVMIEMAAGMIADQMPPTREVMDLVAKRYNRKFRRHWDQIIEFLKLHYVLSAREDSAYWQENRAADSVPDMLREQLSMWRRAAELFRDNRARAAQLRQAMPHNRDLLKKVSEFGFQKR